jgi:hypothetical protein
MKEGNQIILVRTYTQIFSPLFYVFPFVSSDFERSSLFVPFGFLER